MSLFRHCFNGLKEVENGMILLGDDYKCQVNGIWYVKLSLLDGIIRIPSHLRCVFEIRRNLISLNTLDALGCSIKIENGTIYESYQVFLGCIESC